MNKLYDWAKEKGIKNTQAQHEGEPSPFGYNLANLLILQRIKKSIGLDRAERLYYGAAPLKPQTR